MRTGIFLGNGDSKSELLQLIPYYQRPYVAPVLCGDTTVFPNYYGFCTYGYNLLVNDYRGYVPSSLSAVPYDRGALKIGYVRGRNSAVASGLDVIRLNDRDVTFIPTFDSEDSAKQKIRGMLYGPYDKYLSLVNCRYGATMPSGSNVSGSSLKAYVIELSNGVSIIGGFAVFQVNGIGDDLVGVTLSCCYNRTRYYPSPFYKIEDGSLMLDDNSSVEYGDKFLTYYGKKIVRCGGNNYVVTRFDLVPYDFGSGGKYLVISPPMIDIYLPSRSSVMDVSLIQYGMTFGRTADIE